MRIWEVHEGYDPYSERRGSYSRGGGMYSHRDSFEEGRKQGWREAMEEAYGDDYHERTIHRSGVGLGDTWYGSRDPYMMGGDEMDMRRRRDSRGRYM